MDDPNFLEDTLPHLSYDSKFTHTYPFSQSTIGVSLKELIGMETTSGGYPFTIDMYDKHPYRKALLKHRLSQCLYELIKFRKLHGVGS